MKITIQDQSVTQVADPSAYIAGGVLHFELNFHCAHENARIEENNDIDMPNFGYSVYCPDCKNKELEDSHVDDILQMENLDV